MENGETQPAGAVTKRNHPPPLEAEGWVKKIFCTRFKESQNLQHRRTQIRIIHLPVPIYQNQFDRRSV